MNNPIPKFISKDENPKK
ncbi:unnamed protein product, partial [Rhizophagus irregularis]